MRGTRGVALLLALLVVVLGGAVLVSALVWTGAELRIGRSWSDLAATEAELQTALADVLTDSLWGSIRPGETATVRTRGTGPSDSTRVLAVRLGDSLGFVTGQVWGPRSGSGVGLLVRLMADSTGALARVRARPWLDRAWISLLPP